jgi:hypothetical protein
MSKILRHSVGEPAPPSADSGLDARATALRDGRQSAAVRARYRAMGFMTLSVALMCLLPLVVGASAYFWFLVIGVLLLSYSRFRGIEQGFPCVELCFIIPPSLSGYLFKLLPSARIPSVDELLLKFDANFFYPEALAGKFFQIHPAIPLFFGVVYWGIPLAGVLLYLALPNRAAVRRKYILTNAFTLLIFFFYRICPASGPRALIGTAFPNAIPNLAEAHARIIPHVALNAVPSGHFTWALIMFWFARRYCGNATKVAAGAFLLLTLIATLGKGEHYVIDLIVAAPFAAGVWALSGREWRLAIVSLSLTLLWCVALEKGWLLPVPRIAVWLLCILTLAPFVPDPRVNLFSRAPL